MRSFYTAILCTIMAYGSKAQTISRVTIGNTGEFDKITFTLNEQVLLSVSKNGNMIVWGLDRFLGQTENYLDQVTPYNGRVEYYAETDNESFKGKIKSIAGTYITYYASYDRESLRGKIKSIGAYAIDYYMEYENEAYRGNIKSIGQLTFSWYPSTENAGLKGKLKNIGNTAVSYYSSFDDKAYQGKVKSIDRNSFTYYSSLERDGYRGALKSGNPFVISNGIKFYVR